MAGGDDGALAFALAKAAGAAIRPHFRSAMRVDNKTAQGFDPVTAADREAETRMRELIAAERPGDAVHGEEFSNATGRTGRTWILDPIDGTRAFIAGLPTWGTLIALVNGSKPVLGLMHQPVLGETFVADADGAFLIGHGTRTPLATRACESLALASAATTSPDAFEPREWEAFERLHGAVRAVRYGTDCYGYAMLAAGFLDVVVEAGLKAVDIAPFVPIVERAGGRVTDWAGEPIAGRLTSGFAGDVIAVGDPELIGPVVAALAAPTR